MCRGLSTSQKPLPCANPAQQLEEALPSSTAASWDPRSELKAFARFWRRYLVLYRETHSISINFSDAQRAAGSEELP